MNTIIRHIEYLISRKDCVIIPGLGALLAKYKSACYDDVNQAYLPPHRVFTFNSDIRNSDGLLVNSVSRSLGVSFERAAKIVEVEVDTMKHQLLYFQELSLGKVGMLSYNMADGTISFTPYEADRLSVNTLWLSSVKAPKLALRKPAAPARATSSENKHVVTPKIKKFPVRRFSKLGRIAASVAVLLGIWFLASTPLKIDDAMLASLAPELKSSPIEEIVPQQYDCVEPQVVSETSNDEETPAETVTNIDNSGDVSQDLSQESLGFIFEEPTENYYIVVGSFNSTQSTKAYIDQFPNCNLKACFRGTHYRVYIAQYSDRDEATMGCLKARENFSQAWVGEK